MATSSPRPARPDPATPIRVVYFVSNYHRFTGSQKSLMLLLRDLPRERVTPLVVFPGEGKCVDRYREAGIPVRVLPAPPELDTFGGGLKRTSWAERAWLLGRHVVPYAATFAQVLREHGADIAHFNNTRSMLLAGLGATFTRTPKVWHVRGDERSLGHFSQSAALLSDRIICVADGVRSSVPRLLQGRCHTVYNGVDVPNEEPTRDRAALLSSLSPSVASRGEDLLLVSVGSIVPFKGNHHLLEALLRVEELDPDVARRTILVLVGDQPDSAYGQLVRRLADRPGLRQIRFAGWDDRPLDWMRAADAVVLPTVERETLTIGEQSALVHGTEGFSRTVLEAMACGRPVIGTRVAGVPEQVVDGVTGWLCAPSDPSALTAAIRQLGHMSPAQRRTMGDAGRERVVSRFSVSRTVEGTLRVYRELLGH